MTTVCCWTSGLFCIKVVGANFIPTDKAKSDLVKGKFIELGTDFDVGRRPRRSWKMFRLRIWHSQERLNFHSRFTREGKMSFSIFSCGATCLEDARSADRACLCFMRFSAFISQRPEATWRAKMKRSEMKSRRKTKRFSNLVSLRISSCQVEKCKTAF